MTASKPAAVPLDIGGRRLATAYPHRPPTKKQPDWSWRLVWSAEGANHQRSLGRISDSEVPSALLSYWISEIDPSAGGDLEADRSGVQTLTDLLRAWYAVQEGRKARPLTEATLAIYRRSCEYVRDASIGSISIRALTPSRIGEFVEELADPAYRARRTEKIRASQPDTQTPIKSSSKGYGTATIEAALRVLGIVFKWGREEGYPVPSGLKVADYNPTKGKRGRAKEGRVYRSYTPTQEETAEFFESLKKSPLKLGTLIAWKAGLRISEVAGLRWCDIDQTPFGTVLQVGESSRGKAKTGTRRVAISASTAELISTYRSTDSSPSDYLFQPNAGKRLGGALTGAQEHRGTDYDRQFTFHGLRRRWTLNQLEGGVPVNVYADQSGHSPEVALRHYARVSDQDRAASVLRVDEKTGGNDIYKFLSEKGLTVQEAIALIEAGLAGSVANSVYR